MQRAATESFCLQKVSGDVHFTLCGATRRCYENALRAERAGRGFTGVERMHTPRNGNRRRRIPFRPAEHRRIYRRCGESGAAGTAAASGVYAVASGMKTRWPERPGQRQQCGLCAEHDSPPGRPVQPDKFAVLSKKQYPAVQQGNRKQTNDSKQLQNLPDRRNVKVRKRKEGRCMREGEKRCEAPPSRPERTISPEGVHASACGRSGKKGCQGKLTAPYKGARGMPGHISPEKAGFPPPPGCYLPLDS